jgi:hypothetical protein
MDKKRIKHHIESILHELQREIETDQIQPKLDPSLLLLCGNYIQGDTHIDLYGTYCIVDDTCEVLDFTLTGSKIPLWDLQPAGSNICADLTTWINGSMKSREELAEEARQDALISAAEDRKLNHD